MRGERLGRAVPVERLARGRVALGAVVLASALSVALLAPAAKADDLAERRDQLKQQLAKTKADLNESSEALSAAALAVDQTQNRLDSARAILAQSQADLAAAQAHDATLAAKLKKTQAALARAKAAVKAGQAKLDAKKALAGEMVRDQYQQKTNLMPLAVLTDTRTTGDLATRLQWATTMFDTTQAKIDELTALQRQLTAERARQAKLEAQVAAERAEAADALRATRRLEAQAAANASAVAGLLGQRQAAEQAAAADVAQDKAQYAGLTKERAAVEHRIAVRIARAEAKARAEARAKAARQAAAERAAAKAAAAARKAALAKASARAHARTQKASPNRSSSWSRPSSPQRSASTVARSSGAHHGFVYPVSAPITSPYGMRFHPVLRYWKLHDGTDFGAGCGTPIHAAYSGRVAERYYNAGYGNRLIIDHGRVDGRYVTTAYNHAIRYTVGVGQRVSRGEVIGYVGSTGYSTGCHLHLMVYLNGALANPMSWY